MAGCRRHTAGHEGVELQRAAHPQDILPGRSVVGGNDRGNSVGVAMSDRRWRRVGDPPVPGRKTAFQSLTRSIDGISETAAVTVTNRNQEEPRPSRAWMAPSSGRIELQSTAVRGFPTSHRPPPPLDRVGPVFVDQRPLTWSSGRYGRRDGQGVFYRMFGRRAGVSPLRVNYRVAP